MAQATADGVSEDEMLERVMEASKS
jgi:hypothetical protein